MRRIGSACLVWLCVLGSARGQDGLFADFSTSMGDFTVDLDYARAPRAVASFVGLATGEGGWADPQGNVWHTPFYDGLLFHRIATNAAGVPLAIQGGGIPYCGISYSDLPAGPAWSDGQVYYFRTTNPPGVTTNDFIGGLVPFVTDNAAAVPTNYWYGGARVETNAPVLTRTVLYLEQWSSNETKLVVDSKMDQIWYTNRLSQVVAKTNYATIFTVTTNSGSTGEVLLHRLQLSMATTSTIWQLSAGTNFSNAGYYLLDSSTNGLTHSNGVISMANSGPNTDGSQFFIMATNWPNWDGSYTVFGHVTTGMNVVTSIAAVAVQGAGSRPVEDVVLNSVMIRRVGAAAMGFNIASQGLPEVGSAPISEIKATGNMARIEVEVPAYSEILFRVSTNGLRSWQADDWGYRTNGNPVAREVERAVERHAFFHASCVRYADAWTAPTSHVGLVFTFDWDTVPVTHYRAWFTNAPFLWEKTQGANSLSGELWGFPNAPYWTHFPYSAKFNFTDNLAQYSYALWFDPGKVTNRFTCTVSEWIGGTYWITGTFTVD